MADKSVAGWIIVDEYLTDELASNSDEKRLRQAEARALRKKKAKSSRIIVPRARHLLRRSKLAAKQQVQTSSPNERVKPAVR